MNSHRFFVKSSIKGGPKYASRLKQTESAIPKVDITLVLSFELSTHIFQIYADYTHIPLSGKYLLFTNCFHKSFPSVSEYFPLVFPQNFRAAVENFQGNFENFKYQ